MKQKIKQSLSFFLKRVLKLHPDSLLYLAYYVHNIRPGHHLADNGEGYLLRKVNRFFSNKNRIVVFDVGANDGMYSNLVCETIKNASLYAFEPNYELVKVSNYGSAKVFTIGLGDKSVQANLFVNEDALQEASVYEGVATYLAAGQKEVNTKVLDIEIKTIDEFCVEQKIENINFLKIDTEGNEFAVLCGARQMLAENRIDIIQFEFNEMNVIARVFLKDFYDLLSDKFDIFRLHKNTLFPLGEYKPHNEIFVWQNLVAVNKSVVSSFLAV